MDFVPIQMASIQRSGKKYSRAFRCPAVSGLSLGWTQLLASATHTYSLASVLAEKPPFMLMNSSSGMLTWFS
jgi:hypothetical protein